MVQSSHVSPSATKSVFEAHHKYLSKELETEIETLNTFSDAANKTMTAGRLMVSLTMEHFQAKLKWLEKGANWSKQEAKAPVKGGGE
jgi:hypothetical protein